MVATISIPPASPSAKVLVETKAPSLNATESAIILISPAIPIASSRTSLAITLSSEMLTPLVATISIPPASPLAKVLVEIKALSLNATESAVIITFPALPIASISTSLPTSLVTPLNEPVKFTLPVALMVTIPALLLPKVLLEILPPLLISKEPVLTVTLPPSPLPWSNTEELTVLLLRVTLSVTSKSILPPLPALLVEVEILESDSKFTCAAMISTFPALPLACIRDMLSISVLLRLTLPPLIASSNTLPAFPVPVVLTSISELVRLICVPSSSISPTKSLLVSKESKPEVVAIN